MIDLSKDQLQVTIHNVLNKEEGLNELLEMILNGLMKLQHDTSLPAFGGTPFKGIFFCADFTVPI